MDIRSKSGEDMKRPRFREATTLTPVFIICGPPTSTSMVATSNNLTTLAACVASTIFVSRFLAWYQKTKKLPPGPPKLPLLDNIHNMPDGLDWVKFAEIGKACGSDVIHLSALGSSIVVLNSYEAARDLLDKRSGIYSGRFESTVLNDLGGMNAFFSVVPAGDYWKACRRQFMKHFGPANKKTYQSRDGFYISRFLHQLVESPDDFPVHIRDLVGATSLSMAYGLKPRAGGDPNIQLAEDFVGWFSTVASSGAFLVDLFPHLKHLPTWFPGTSFHQIAAKTAEYSKRSRKGLLKQSIEATQMGHSMPSFVSESLREIEEDPTLSEQDRQEAILRTECTAVQIYAAAADTTVSSISTFFLAMICYPDVQRKLQEELDSALHGRMPTHNDLTDLPYLTAVIMEVLRWKPVSPMGIPHRVTQDNTYKGYYIPKDSIVVANQWAMLQNPNEYPEPEIFRPERFLKNGKIDDALRNPADIAFGFGKRICPGKHIAESELALVIASVISNFDLAKKIDGDGKMIEPPQDIHPGIVCHPKEFLCTIKPRSSRVQEMLEAWALQEDGIGQ